MECQICFEIFDSSNFTPKILIQCGHSFCKICLDIMSEKLTIITCPICREKTKLMKKDRIPTNYSLIELLEKNKDNLSCKNILEKFKYFDEKDYKNLNCTIKRISEPKKLILKKIQNDDFIYVEEIENSQNFSLFSNLQKRNKRYNFNKKSIFSFFYNEYSNSISVYRKSSLCKHEFSCFEKILRNIFSFGCFSILIKYPFNYFLRHFTKNEENVNNWSFYGRIIMISIYGLLNVSKCLFAYYIDDSTRKH